MPSGMPPRALGALIQGREQRTGKMAVPFVLEVQCIAGTTTYSLFSSNAPSGFRVIKAWGVMTGAGAAADTVVVDNGTTAITDTADLSPMSDTDQFDFSQINDATHEIAEGGSLRVVTASDALCHVYIMCVWTN